MNRRRSHISSAAAQTPGPAARALAEALRRPPLRVTMRHEPTDRIDAYPTLMLSPCGTASALHSLDRALGHSGAKLLVDGGHLLEDRGNSLTNAMRDRLGATRLGSSLLVDTATAIEVGRMGATRITLACVDGPVDASDARAIERAIASATPPMDADLRAAAVLQCGANRQVWAQFRDLAVARRFLSSLVTGYVARVIDESIDSVPALDLGAIRMPAPSFAIRPNDFRIDGCTIAVKVRSASSRTILTLTADRSTGRWYA